MAEKQAVFSLRVDTGNSVNDINSFDKSLQSLTKDVNTTKQALEDPTAVDTFAQNLQELNAKVEAGGLTMRQLSKVVREYQSIAMATGETSPIGSEALKQAAKLTDKMGDVKKQTVALSSDFVRLDTAVQGIETGAAVFQGVQSAIALTGVENEKLMQTMVKLQAVQGVANSVNTIAKNLNSESVLGLQLKTAWEGIYATAVGTSTGAMKLFRIALLATGIGAIVVGLGLLIANFEKVTKFVQMAYDKFNKLGAGVKIVLSVVFPVIGVFYGLIKALEYFGVIDDEVTRKNKANAQARSNYTKKMADEHIRELNRTKKSISERYDHEINMAKASGKDTAEIEQNKRKEMLKNGRAVLEEMAKKEQAYKKELAYLKSLGEADSERAKALKKLISENSKAQATQYEENKKTANEIEVANAEAHQRAVERYKEKKKLRDDEIAQVKKYVKEAGEVLITGEERELYNVKEKYDERLKLARKFYKEDSPQVQSLLIAQMNEENDIKLKYQTQEYEQQQENYNKQKEDDAKKLKDLEDSEKRKLELYMQYQAILEDEYQAELRAYEKTQEEKAKSLNESLGLGTITQEEYMTAMLKLEDDYNNKIVEINKKKNKAIADEEKKLFDERIKKANDVIEAVQKRLDQLKQINDIAKMFEENRLAESKQTAEQQTLILDNQMNQQLSNQNLNETQKTAIQQSFAKKKYDIEYKLFQEEEKIKRSQFNRDKAFRIAQIAIDTASAITKGIAEFGPPPSPAGIASIISASAIGIAQSVAVAKQQYQGGSAPQMPSFGSPSTGMSSNAFQVPNVNQQTTAPTAQNATNPNLLTTPYIPVVVVETDITGVQNKVKTQESKSLFG